MDKENERAFKRHQKDIEKRVDHGERKTRKAAGKLRRGFVEKGRERSGPITEDNWEGLLDAHGRSKKRPLLSDVIATLDATEQQQPAAEPVDWSRAGVVMAVSAARCKLFFEGREVDAFIPPHISMRQTSALAVGDRVDVVQEGEAWRVESMFPRRTVLARPDPLKRHMQRLIAANIDVVVHVVAIKAPPLRPRLIDRYLIAIQRGGALPVVCVNKIDLVDEEQRRTELAKLSMYADLGVPVIPCSTETGEGLDELRMEVEGRTSALVGHSGVGKSSILNALDERLQLTTRTVRKQGTGRHTTTRSTLYDFGNDTYLIDTPGIREFGLWDLDRDSLRDYFPEFEEAAESCRFTDCSHVHEPDCEVKDRVAAGQLSQARYETYVRLYEDLAA